MEASNRRRSGHGLEPLALAYLRRSHVTGQHDTSRLIAWSLELRRVHDSLREALFVTREALQHDEPASDFADDLTLLCRGFCTALDGHHRGEDRWLFPAIEAAHPHLKPVLRALQQDHSMIDHLLNGLRAAAELRADRHELDRHLEGIEAIMESHFRYEERQLITVLDGLAVDAALRSVLGPL